MNCPTARQTLELARVGDVEPRGLDDAARHLNDCPECQAAVAWQDDLDAQISATCREVAVPAGLKDRLLEGLVAKAQAEPGLASSAAESARLQAEPPLLVPAVSTDCATATAAAPPGKTTRRRWLWSSVGAAAALVVAGVVLKPLILRRPDIDLDKVAETITEPSLDPAHLNLFVAFRNGKLAELPVTMDTAALRSPPSRLGNADVAVYFFTLSGPRRTTLNGRLAVVPAAVVVNPPKSTSFGGDTPYYLGPFVTTSWVEGKFAYVCCLDGTHTLERLKPRNSTI